MNSTPFLNRVKLRNYKSIGTCDVEPKALTMIVGRNGSGKSNFLKAIKFVTDSLRTSLDQAIKSQGGIEEVRRRSPGHPHNFAIQLEFNLSEHRVAKYAFEIGSQPKGGFVVKSEQLEVLRGSGDRDYFHVSEGDVIRSSATNMPKAARDRLYLVTASGLEQFVDAYDALLAMGFYNLNPEQMKEIQKPDAGQLLHHDGSNIASVLARLSDDNPPLKERITEYLRAIVPDIVDVDRVPLGPYETLQFRQQVKGSQHPWRFYAASMSDGTLRALGTLVATMQLVGHSNQVRLVGIEEPETALHPAAAGALMDALRENAVHTQIIVTSHSPDLLDNLDPDADGLLVTQACQGTTEIGPADPACMDSIRSHLYSPGDLLRMDQLQPDRRVIGRQLSLVFD